VSIAARWQPAAWLVLAAAMVVMGVNMGVRQTFGLFLEPMTAALEIPRGSFAFAIAVQNLLWGLLQPVCGGLADRYGTGRLLALGGALYAGGIVVMAGVPTPLGLHLGGGLLVGMAVAACGFPLVLSAVARAAPEDRRSTWLGLATAGGSIGQFVLLPGTQAVMGLADWHGGLLALAAVSALVIPLAFLLRGKPAKVQAHEQSLREAFDEAVRHKGFLLLTAGFFVCGFHIAFVATHLPAYVAGLGLPALVGATALSLVGLFNVLGAFACGWAGGRMRKKHLLSGIYLARAVVIAAMLVAPKTEITVYLFAAAFGLMWLGTVPLTSGLVGQIFGPRYLATLFGMVMLSHQVGAFFGAWLGGLLYDITGSYDIVWGLAIALGVVAAALHAPIPDRPIARAQAATG
jgi:MFS family permease